jgi:diacylglycerol kinase family enzyme
MDLLVSAHTEPASIQAPHAFTTMVTPNPDSAAPSTPPSTPPSAPLFIVFNAGSGHGDSAAAQAAIHEACEAAGRAFELLMVTPMHSVPETARDAVRRAQAVGGVVVAAGGDGTLNAVAQAVLGSGCVFGVLPQGTFNYFGRAHGIPADTAAAMQLLLHARAQPVQVGLVNERVFLVNASLGLYPKLLEDREGWKAQFGRSRLVAFGAGLVTLLRGRRSLRLHIEVQNAARDVRTATLFVGNNALQMQQLGLPLAQAIEAGSLGAVMLKPVGRWAMVLLLLRGALGHLGDADQVLTQACTQLTVDRRRAFGPRRLKVATDGEVARMQLPLRFSVSSEPLWLIRPETPPADASAP